MKKKIFMITIGGCCIIWGIYNLIQNDKFLKVSLVQMLTLFVAVVISYYLVQQKNDKRRKVDFINKSLREIMISLEDDKMLDIDTKRSLTIQKSIANRLQIIENISFKEIKADMEYVVAQFDEIRELYSNHMTNPLEVEMDINKHKTNISDKCMKIEAKLFEI